jgi:arylsulfatase A-like enzyme
MAWIGSVVLLIGLVHHVSHLAVPALADTPEPPNLILLLTDDQTLDSMSQGMPFLDSRPGSHWVEFSNAFLNTPLCCPSRATILSGLYAHHTGVRSNSDGQRFDASSTIATWLHDAGYRTGLIGKYLNHYPWGLGPFVPPGWDDWFAFMGQEGYYNYTVNDNGSSVSFGANAQDYSTDVFAARAESFIASSAGPFFLMISPLAPHEPSTPPSRYANLGVTVSHSPNFNELDVSDKPAFVQARPLAGASGVSQWDGHRIKGFRSLRAVDDLFRSAYSLLEAQGELDNTVIMFMTDNGVTIGEHRLSGKSCVYEECVGTPMLVRYPWADGRIEPGLVSNIDVAPTFAELAGFVPPMPQDGSSLVPLLRNDHSNPWRDSLLLENFAGGGNPPFWAIRTQAWKYSQLGTGEVELYDLLNDPFELENVAGHPEFASVESQLGSQLAALKIEPARSLLPVLRIDDAEAQEGAAGMLQMTVSLSLLTSSTVTVSFSTSSGTASAGDDYAETSGTLTFDPGEQEQLVEIPVVNDAVAEPNETFAVTLAQSTNSTIGDGQGIATILNDDTTPEVSIADASVIEGDIGNSVIQLTVSLSAPSPDEIAVSFSTTDGTARQEEDYIAASGTVTFPPGEIVRDIGVVVLGDELGEPNEDFVVNIIGTTGASIGDPQGMGTILNDDPFASLSVGDVSLLEGNAGFTQASFAISLSDASADPVSVTFTTIDGTAVAGSDYTSTSGDLLLAPGETSAIVSVPVRGDTIYESTESFVLELTGASVWISDSTGTASVVDDDPMPTVSIGDTLITEGNAGTKPAFLLVQLSGPSSFPITVAYATTGDSARAGSDYQSTSGVLSFAPGDTLASVAVVVFGDTIFESGERFFVDLASPVGAVIADGRGIVTIRNDDTKG